MKTAATLVNTNANVWHLCDAGGQHLAALEGVEDKVLGPAAACLVADRGFPEGEWIRRGPGRYSYLVP